MTLLPASAWKEAAVLPQMTPCCFFTTPPPDWTIPLHNEHTINKKKDGRKTASEKCVVVVECLHEVPMF